MLTSRSCARLFSALVAATAVLAADPSPVVAREPTDVFPQPEDRRSTDGALRTTLRVAITPTAVVDWPRRVSVAVETSTYEGTIPGPTLRVKPGDVLEIDLP